MMRRGTLIALSALNVVAVALNVVGTIGEIHAGKYALVTLSFAVSVFAICVTINLWRQWYGHRTSSQTAHGNPTLRTSPGWAGTFSFTPAGEGDPIPPGYIPGGGPGEDPRVANARAHVEALTANNIWAERFALDVARTVATQKPGEVMMFATVATLPNGSNHQFDINRPPAPLEQDALEVGEIIGQRCWIAGLYNSATQGIQTLRPEMVLTFPPDAFVLASITQPYLWTPGVPVLGIIKNPRVIASGGGIHACKTVKDARTYGIEISHWRQSGGNPAGDLPDFHPLAIVRGSCAMWGQVIEHENGYRSEFAKVKSIDEVIAFFGTCEHLLAKLRWRYGVTSS
jgi:hypothetical protein